MNKLKISSLLFFFLFSLSASAQTIGKWIEAGDTAFVHSDFYPAFKYYEIALEYDSSRADVWYKYAQAAQKFNAHPSAEKGYRRVLGSSIASNFPDAALQLALVEQGMGKYEKAKSHFEFFLENNPRADEEQREMATREINNCNWALEMEAEKQDLEVTRLDTSINSPYADFAPMPLDNKLFYSSFQFVDKKDKHNPPRLFNKLLVSEEEGRGTLLPKEVNEEGKHVAHMTFNEDNTKIVYTICEYIDVADIRCDLYERERLNEFSWGPSKKLSINAIGYTSTNPSLGYDQLLEKEVLYFSSDRPGGKGGMDIWYSLLDENSKPEAPKPAEAINSKGDDITPFFFNPTQTLYLSSNGYENFGGFDIYKSEKEGSTWTKPENLKMPINSSYNDLYYTIDEVGTTAYFSSNRPGSIYLEKEKEACCNDLYKHSILTNLNLQAYTFDNVTQTPLEGVTVELYEVDLYGNENLVASLDNPSGNDFKFPIEINKIYKIKATKKRYSTAIETIDLTDPKLASTRTIERNLYLNPDQLELQVLTIDANDREPIIGATVELQQLVDGKPKTLGDKINEYGNDFIFPLKIGETYVIQANKLGYETRKDTIIITKEDVDRLGNRITVELPMIRISFEDFLPLAVYFDNDMPESRSTLSYTDKSYNSLYSNYYSKKQEFIKEFTSDLSENEQFLTEQRFETFFEREVRGGQRDLENFTKKLTTFLEKGNSIELVFKGFASPRASQDYNKLLSQRRVTSLRNHFWTFNNGALQSFFETGQLKIITVAYGEETADSGISDDIFDRKNSIYSILASVERRVEIVDARTENKKQ